MRLSLACLLLLFFFGVSCSQDPGEEEAPCHDCAVTRAEAACAAKEDGWHVDAENSEYGLYCEEGAASSVVWCGHTRNFVVLGNGAEICDPKEDTGGSLEEERLQNFYHWSWQPQGCTDHCANDGAREYEPCGDRCVPFGSGDASCGEPTACF
tara:strand:- start:81 stop:539 length:459 start_codon:yes stop_codon:yes gene_type:complete